MLRSLLFQTTGKSRERAECPGSRLLALALEVSTPQPKINDLCRLLGGVGSGSSTETCASVRQAAAFRT